MVDSENWRAQSSTSRAQSAEPVPSAACCLDAFPPSYSGWSFWIDVFLVPVRPALAGRAAAFTLAGGLALWWAIRHPQAGDDSKVDEEIRRRQQGVDGEIAVRQALDALSTTRVYDGIHTVRHGDIDHVVAGPNGVFLVETKAYSQVPTGEQLEAIAEKLRERVKWLQEQISLEVQVQPIIVLQGTNQHPMDAQGIPVRNEHGLVRYIQARSGSAPLSVRQRIAIQSKLERLSLQTLRNLDRRPAQ